MPKKAEYLLDIKLRVNWKEIERSMDPLEIAEFLLKTKPYVGLFVVYDSKKISRSRGYNDLEKKTAFMNPYELTNMTVILKEEKWPLHAYLKNGKGSICYTKNKITKEYDLR